MHSLVCLNGQVVWDPNGFAVPPDWNGIIESRDWQVCQPFSWNVLVTLDPMKPTGHLTSYGPGMADIISCAKALFARLNKRNPPARPGVSYGDVMKAYSRIAAAYTDAATDELAEKAVLEVLRATKITPRSA